MRMLPLILLCHMQNAYHSADIMDQYINLLTFLSWSQSDHTGLAQ